MKPGGGRLKGAAFERWIAKQFRPYFPKARRGLGQTRGAEVPDVDGTLWWVEAKRYAKLTPSLIGRAMGQGMRDRTAAKDARRVMVVAKADRKAAVVYFEPPDGATLAVGMPLTDYLSILTRTNV